jgi:hypothetical protein
MTAVEGASKLLSSEEKSQMKASSSAESTAGERDVFREIPLRYAGKYDVACYYHSYYLAHSILILVA